MKNESKKQPASVDRGRGDRRVVRGAYLVGCAAFVWCGVGARVRNAHRVTPLHGGGDTGIDGRVLACEPAGDDDGYDRRLGYPVRHGGHPAGGSADLCMAKRALQRLSVDGGCHAGHLQCGDRRSGDRAVFFGIGIFACGVRGIGSVGWYR